MEGSIFRVIVPMENEVVIKNGKRKVTPRKVYPGYVLVEMLLTDTSWYVVRNTPGVTGFVGTGAKPVPLLRRKRNASWSRWVIMKAISKSTSRRAIAYALSKRLLRISSLGRGSVSRPRQAEGFGFHVWPVKPRLSWSFPKSRNYKALLAGVFLPAFCGRGAIPAEPHFELRRCPKWQKR